MGKLGWIAAFVYCAGAALRLARFNTMLEVADKRWFQGIAEPGGRGAGRGLRLVDRRLRRRSADGVRWWAWAVTLFAGLTMVSNVKFYSFKTINLRQERIRSSRSS